MKYVKVLKDSNTGTVLYKSDKHFMVSNSTFHESKMFSDKKDALKHFRSTIQATWKQWKSWKAQKDLNESSVNLPKHITSYTLESRKDNEEYARSLVLQAQNRLKNPDSDFELLPEDKCNLCSDIRKEEIVQRINCDKEDVEWIKRFSRESKAHFITELDKLIEKGEYK